MTSVKCPYCEGPFRIPQPKSGTFKPTCRKCNKTFALVLKVDGENVRFRVARLEDLQKSQARETTPPVTGDDTRGDEGLEETPQPVRSDTRATPRERTREEFTRASENDDVPDESSDSFIEAELADRPPAPPMPEKLGGYRIIRELGRGGLGVVYLANQVSLDRPVALKTILGKIAASSKAISRFTREAYAAAQLVHHNVVQIYDLGRDGQTNFFSMEFVPGKNLAQLVKEEGPQDPEKAARLILQAARGLHFAHNQGMVHRDIKPANLMLSDQGVVKVADLGLVKLAGDAEDVRDRGFDELAKMSAEDLTLAGYTLGTANYMAPEQADNSSTVDHRADIYALGCSLYVLLTGRPPFRGKSAIDVISKHRNEPVLRPEQLVNRIDERLSDIVVKMVAKDPDDRYHSLSEVIEELETYLGISRAEVMNPAKKHVQMLQDSQNTYYGLPLAKLRGYTPVAFAGLCLVGLLILSFVGWKWATGIIGFTVVTPVTYALIRGFKDRGLLFEKIRGVLLGSGVRRWLQAIFFLLLILIVLFVARLLTIWIVFAVFGVTVAALYYFAVDSQVNAAREDARKPVEDYLNSKRLSGVDEHSLQRFVAKYSGKNWEEYFEDLFGYPALRRARLELSSGELGGKRKKSRPIRDMLIDRFDAMLEEEKQKADQEKLQEIEKDALVASGIDPDQAEQQAAEFAGALVREAAQWRDHASRNVAAASPVPANPATLAQQKRDRIKAMLADARSGRYRKEKTAMDRLDGPLTMFLGSHVRFILGTLLIVGCALWIRQNGIFDSVTVDTLKDAATSTIEQGGAADVESVAEQVGIDTSDTQPLNFPVVGGWFIGFGPGLGGLLLVFSALCRGWKMSFFLIPAALIAWLGPFFGMPGIGSVCPPEVTSMAVGGVLALLGFFFGVQD